MSKADTRVCPYCDGTVHYISDEGLWECSDCSELWSDSEDGWEV